MSQAYFSYRAFRDLFVKRMNVTPMTLLIVSTKSRLVLVFSGQKSPESTYE